MRSTSLCISGFDLYNGKIFKLGYDLWAFYPYFKSKFDEPSFSFSKFLIALAKDRTEEFKEKE